MQNKSPFIFICPKKGATALADAPSGLVFKY